MRYRFLCLALFISASPWAGSQITPAPRTSVEIKNPQQVVEVQGAAIEVFPERRVTVQSFASGREVMRETAQTAGSAPLVESDGVLIYNHAYHAYGYATGEISFKFKAGKTPVSPLPAVQFPGFRRLGNLNAYVVYARTPVEFIELYRRLQERSDIEWVVPNIEYVPKQ
jgi:hypothetical protein